MHTPLSIEGPGPPSREEFIVRRKRLQRFLEAWQVGAAFIGIALSLGSLILAHRAGLPIPRDWAGAIFLLVFVAFASVVMIVVKNHAKKFGASCPTCHAALTGVAGQIALAAGRCGKCGAVVCR